MHDTSEKVMMLTKKLDELLLQRDEFVKSRDTYPPQLEMMQPRIIEISIKDRKNYRKLWLRSNTRDMMICRKDILDGKIMLASSRIMSLSRELEELEGKREEGG